MTQQSLLVSLLVLLFLQFSLVPNTSANTPHWKFASAGTSSPISTRERIGSPDIPTIGILSREYDVYIVITPFENTIGRAVAEELSRQLSDSTLSTNNEKAHREATSVICIVQCPPLVSDTCHSNRSMDEDKSKQSSFSNDDYEEGITKNILSFQSQLLQRLRRLCSIFYQNTIKISSKKDKEIWLDRFCKTSPILVLPSLREGDTARADLSFDPIGDTSSIRKSSETCITRIQSELLRCMASEVLGSKKATSPTTMSSTMNSNRRAIDSNTGNDSRDDILSATIFIRGILFNPYGCPPTLVSEKSHPYIDPRQRLSMSPLGAYKLLSIAIFIDEALSAKKTRIDLPIREILHQLESPFSNDGSVACTVVRAETDAAFNKSSFLSPLRIIIVGTEAARGLPKMGIPVPDLEDATESSIRKKLLLDFSKDKDKPPNSESGHWEVKYAEMNALVVLYLKALESIPKAPLELSATKSTSRGTAGVYLYLGVVSPGMTQESFNIAHVPESARTVAFRWKLWLCRRQRVFDWLKKCEIAKSTEDAGSLLVKALLNTPMETYYQETENNEAKRWDDVYPSGSFVGARSGTGGPLCEQSLLLYNVTTNKVGIAVDAARGDCDPCCEVLNHLPSNETSNSTTTIEGHDGINFLANRRLQDIVYHVVREIIAD